MIVQLPRLANRQRMRNLHTKQTGITLIEVLATVIVTAIGLLGLAGLQNLSLRLSYDSYLRTQTAFFASDLFDRIRANPQGNYDNLNATTSIRCNLPTANCQPAGMMQHDIQTWRARVEDAFPDVNLTLNTNAPDNDTYTVTFRWDSRTDDGNNQSASGGDDNRQTFTYTSRVR